MQRTNVLEFDTTADQTARLKRRNPAIARAIKNARHVLTRPADWTDQVIQDAQAVLARFGSDSEKSYILTQIAGPHAVVYPQFTAPKVLA